MSTGAWLFMSFSFLLILVLNFFCFGRLLEDHRNDKR